PDQGACEQVAGALGTRGFSVDFRRVDPERGDRYTLHALKSQRISVPGMQATTREFKALAVQHRGRYDGWATAGITRAAARRDDGGAGPRR
ncbi:MAG: ribonuclease E inhibitor RraB, partial [Gammaproteobacteria bacterium]|nr:ribonuclease E inhibitor RraB [Gammaproteobacteria bacterium]